jgi:hypothetical protein
MRGFSAVDGRISRTMSRTLIELRDILHFYEAMSAAIAIQKSMTTS